MKIVPKPRKKVQKKRMPDARPSIQAKASNDPDTAVVRTFKEKLATMNVPEARVLIQLAAAYNQLADKKGALPQPPFELREAKK